MADRHARSTRVLAQGGFAAEKRLAREGYIKALGSRIADRGSNYLDLNAEIAEMKLAKEGTIKNMGAPKEPIRHPNFQRTEDHASPTYRISAVLV
jgi:hypothetical protein